MPDTSAITIRTNSTVDVAIDGANIYDAAGAPIVGIDRINSNKVYLIEPGAIRVSLRRNGIELATAEGKPLYLNMPRDADATIDVAAVDQGATTEWESNVGAGLYPIAATQGADLVPTAIYTWYRVDPTNDYYTMFNVVFEMVASQNGTPTDDIILDWTDVLAEAFPHMNNPVFHNPTGTLVINDTGPYALINPLALANTLSPRAQPFGLDGTNIGATYTIVAGDRLRVNLISAVLDN